MSRNRFTKEQRDLSPLRELLLPIVAFAAVLLLFLPGLASVDRTAKEAARQGLEDAMLASSGQPLEDLITLASHTRAHWRMGAQRGHKDA